MAKQESGLWEELVEVVRQLLKQIDEALNPEKKQRKLAKVPVPVRNNPPQQHPDLYD